MSVMQWRISAGDVGGGCRSKDLSPYTLKLDVQVRYGDIVVGALRVRVSEWD